MQHEELEEGTTLALDWGKLAKVAATARAVVPVVAQDVTTGAVLVVAFANEVALRETLSRRVAVFWSTSRNELWVKGATSGNTLELVEVRVNCEQNSLLYRVRVAAGQGACHTEDAVGRPRFGCYYRVLEGPPEALRLRFADDGGRLS
jgi:phosphoribosyl-AMP cyclohydrolase